MHQNNERGVQNSCLKVFPHWHTSAQHLIHLFHLMLLTRKISSKTVHNFLSLFSQIPHAHRLDQSHYNGMILIMLPVGPVRDPGPLWASSGVERIDPIRFSRAHTFAKAADGAKLLLLNKLIYPSTQSIVQAHATDHNHNPNVT